MKRNTEGNVYKVCWKKVSSGYSAWLSCIPKLKINGKNEEELSELLFEITMDRYGDGEPCFDFDPPLPAESSEPSYFKPEWFVLGSNEHFRTVGDRAALFSEGLCSYCGAGRGQRTSTPRVLDGIPKSDFAFIWQEQPSAYIVSENFADFFRPLLGGNLQTLPCLPSTTTKKRFFELDLRPAISLQAHRDATNTFGTMCPCCKRESAGLFVCPSIGKGILTAVERSKLTSLDRNATIASGGLTRRICINAQVAQRLKTKSRLKGVLLDRLAKLAPEHLGKFKLATPDKKRR
jgi:hypothetical protein